MASVYVGVLCLMNYQICLQRHEGFFIYSQGPSDVITFGYKSYIAMCLSAHHVVELFWPGFLVACSTISLFSQNVQSDGNAFDSRHRCRLHVRCHTSSRPAVLRVCDVGALWQSPVSNSTSMRALLILFPRPVSRYSTAISDPS
jgi:hypothetical protein